MTGTFFKIGDSTPEPKPPTSSLINSARIASQITTITSVTKKTDTPPPSSSSSRSASLAAISLARFLASFFCLFCSSFSFLFSSLILFFSASIFIAAASRFAIIILHAANNLLLLSSLRFFYLSLSVSVTGQLIYFFAFRTVFFFQKFAERFFF